MLSKDGLRPDMDKVRAIQEILQPKVKTELQRFMGMVQYRQVHSKSLRNICTTLKAARRRNPLVLGE